MDMTTSRILVMCMAGMVVEIRLDFEAAEGFAQCGSATWGILLFYWDIVIGKVGRGSQAFKSVLVHVGRGCIVGCVGGVGIHGAGDG